MIEHECIGLKQRSIELEKAHEEILKFLTEHINTNTKQLHHFEWSLEYYHSRLMELHDILIDNRDIEIYHLKKRITELESELYKNDITLIPEKINVNLKFDKLGKTQPVITMTSDSKKTDEIYDEVGRKWFIPKLNDESYIKIRFIGKDGKELDYRNDYENVYIYGISSSSAIIGNTTFGKGSYKDIRDNFILDKRALRLLLIDPSVWIYALRGTENIEIVESSEDINATL